MIQRKDRECEGCNRMRKERQLNTAVAWGGTRSLVTCPDELSATSKVAVNPLYRPARGFVVANLPSNP